MKSHSAIGKTAVLAGVIGVDDAATNIHSSVTLRPSTQARHTHAVPLSIRADELMSTCAGESSIHSDLNKWGDRIPTNASCSGVDFNDA